MIVDITNEVYTELKNQLVGITVLTGFPETQPNFPCVTIEENSNTIRPDTIDTSGEKHNVVRLDINIFTNSKTKMQDAKNIRNSIDEILSGTYRMNRDFSDVIHNYADSSLYRYVMRYSFTIDNNKTIYRG